VSSVRRRGRLLGRLGGWSFGTSGRPLCSRGRATMLGLGDIVPFLLRRRLLGREHIVENGLEVSNCSRRNRNFRVVTGAGPCYLIKQGVGEEKSRTVTREAIVYRFLQSMDRSSRVTRLTPQFVLFEPSDCVLVLEFVRESSTLLEFYSRSGRFPRPLARKLGEALGDLHREGRSARVRDEFAKELGNNEPYCL